MLIGQFRDLLTAIAVASLLCAAPVMADQKDGPEPSSAGQPAASDLPEAVAELVAAMSSVERVEPLDDDTFAIHSRMQLTGSRIPRDVTITVDDKGNVIDWGEKPFLTRTYTREDLFRTGHVQLAEGLSKIDPAIRNR